tara:strand:- start:17257 stop:18096 length:840 start_codon:yes stop_codon:yes gene_type:complete
MQRVYSYRYKLQRLLILATLVFANDLYAQSIDHTVARAQALLSKQNPAATYQAIQELEPIARENPQHRLANTTLASAYVAAGGIEILSFLPLIKQIDRNQDFHKELERKRDRMFRYLTLAAAKNGSDMKNFVESWQEVTAATDAMMFLFEYIEFIPEVTQESFPVILMASDIYNQADFSLTRGDAIFAGILQFLVIKHRLSYKGYLPTDAQLKEGFLPVVYSLESLEYDLLKLFDYLEQALERDFLYKQDFRQKWQRLEDFMYKHNLELELLLQTLNNS